MRMAMTMKTPIRSAMCVRFSSRAAKRSSMCCSMGAPSQRVAGRRSARARSPCLRRETKAASPRILTSPTTPSRSAPKAAPSASPSCERRATSTLPAARRQRPNRRPLLTKTKARRPPWCSAAGTATTMSPCPVVEGACVLASARQRRGARHGGLVPRRGRPPSQRARTLSPLKRWRRRSRPRMRTGCSLILHRTSPAWCHRRKRSPRTPRSGSSCCARRRTRPRKPIRSASTSSATSTCRWACPRPRARARSCWRARCGSTCATAADGRASSTATSP